MALNPKTRAFLRKWPQSWRRSFATMERDARNGKNAVNELNTLRAQNATLSAAVASLNSEVSALKLAAAKK